MVHRQAAAMPCTYPGRGQTEERWAHPRRLSGRSFPQLCCCSPGVSCQLGADLQSQHMLCKQLHSCSATAGRHCMHVGARHMTVQQRTEAAMTFWGQDRRSVPPSSLLRTIVVTSLQAGAR